MAPPEVLVAEHNRNLAEIFTLVLRDSGLKADGTLIGPDFVEEVRGLRPRLLVVDVLPIGERSFDTLDALRADEMTRAIPVVAMSTSPDLATSARASYNVRATLVKPFDIEPFVQEVRRALGLALMHAELREGAETPGGFMEVAERVLAQQARSIIFRWVQRLKHESPWAERDDLNLASLIDHAPVVLEALDVRLHYERPDDFFEHHPDALVRAREHAHVRRSQGVSFSAALREYALLREELWRTLQDAAPPHVPPEEFFRVERAINGTLDAIIHVTAAELAGASPGSPEWLSQPSADGGGHS